MKKKIYKLAPLIKGTKWPQDITYGPFMSEYSANIFAEHNKIQEYHISRHCFCFLYRKKIADLWIKQYNTPLNQLQQNKLNKYLKFGAIRLFQNKIQNLWNKEPE